MKQISFVMHPANYRHLMATLAGCGVANLNASRVMYCVRGGMPSGTDFIHGVKVELLACEQSMHSVLDCIGRELVTGLQEVWIKNATDNQEHGTRSGSA